MALETGTYVNSLNASNPASTDGVAQADDHIRLIKSTIKATLPNVTGAITATQAELNLMDGVTATTAELNLVDGLTATTAELNKLDGVTASTAELNITDGLTATTAELNKLDGVTASTAELNLVDGLTATTAELNYVDGVTSNIQTQLNTSATNLSNLGGTSTAVWETGTSTSESLVSPAQIRAAVKETPFWDYSSSYFSFPNGNSITTVTHNLGYIPSMMQIELKCITAQNGYSVNDTVQMSGHSGMRGAQFGLMLSTVASNTNIVKLARGNAFTMLSATNGSEFNINKNSWNIRVSLKK